MEWAIQLPIELSHAASRVLMVLAKHANDDGTNCWPSLSTIQTMAQVSRDTVVRCIEQLIAAGIVKREAGAGRRVNHYSINLGAGRPKAASTVPGQTGDLFGGDPVAVRPSDHKAAPGQPANPRRSPTIGPKTGVNRPENARSGPMVRARSPTIGPDSIQTPICNTVESLRQPPPALRVVAGTSVDPAPAKPDPKGSRLPPGWRPKPADIEFARKLGLDPEAVLDEFRDYWTEVPGKAGRKVDWSGTYRNRCRTKAERGARGQPRRQTEQERFREMMRREMGGNDRTVDGEPERESMAALGWSS